MSSLTFVIGTGRSGSTLLSRIVNAHPDVLSLNEFMASVGDAAFPDGQVTGEEFWELLARPAPHFERMIRSGVPLPEFLYTRRPGRFASETTGIPALSLMVLPHLTDDPDGLLDELQSAIVQWPERTAVAHHQEMFGLLCTGSAGQPSSNAPATRQGGRQGCGPRSPTRGSCTCSGTGRTAPCP